MFYKFFGTKRQTQIVEVAGGKFEFKSLSKDTPLKVLWFTKCDIGQSTVAEERVLNIAPFRHNGVACEIRWPNGHQAITLYFFENGELWDEKGFIINKDSLVYMYKDELRIFTKSDGDKLLINKKALKSLGYNESIVLDEKMFYFRNDNAELVPFNFFDYSGTPLLSYKKECICREIMLQIRMFVTKEFAKNHLDVERGQELSALTWDAKTATTENVKLLLTLEKEEDNLEELNANKIYSIINLFELENLQNKFTRYMELFFTAYEQVSMHRVWVESQWFGKKNLTKELDEYHSMVYKKTHSNMDLITKDFIARPDFLELLEDYPTFEKVVRESIGMDEENEIRNARPSW